MSSSRLLMLILLGGALAMFASVSYASSSTSLNLMVFGDDADKGTIRRDSPVFHQVVQELNNQLLTQGYNVYDEVAVTSKETEDGEGGFAQGRIRRTDAEILDIASSIRRPPIDVALLFRIYSNPEKGRFVTRIKVRITGRILLVHSGRFLGTFEVKKILNTKPSCDQKCLSKALSSRAQVLAQELGTALAGKLRDAENDVAEKQVQPDNSGGDGVVRDYILVLDGFLPEERSLVLEEIQRIPGYSEHRVTDCSLRHCEIWMTSMVSNATFNRTLNNLFDGQGRRVRIVVSSNIFKVQKL